MTTLSPLRTALTSAAACARRIAGSSRTSVWIATACAVGVALPALAQNPVDIGVIRDSDVNVVQKLLYPKAGRSELGVHLGIMPFNAYLTTPNLQFSFEKHQSESFSYGLVIGGGYGLKNATFRELESPRYGVAPAAYRYLTSLLLGVQYAPIYAKMNINGTRIVHFDVYGAARVGATLESSVIPGGGIAVAPTVSLSVGTRFFVGESGAIRVALRDDILVETRKLTSSTHVKQNVNISLGFSRMFGRVKGRR